MIRMGIALGAFAASTSGCNAQGGRQGRAWDPYAPIGTVNPDGSYTRATGPGTFDRFVQSSSQCDDYEAAMPTWSASGAYLGRTCRFNASGG